MLSYKPCQEIFDAFVETLPRDIWCCHINPAKRYIPDMQSKAPGYLPYGLGSDHSDHLYRFVLFSSSSMPAFCCKIVLLTDHQEWLSLFLLHHRQIQYWDIGVAIKRIVLNQTIMLVIKHGLSNQGSKKRPKMPPARSRGLQAPRC